MSNIKLDFEPQTFQNVRDFKSDNMKCLVFAYVSLVFLIKLVFCDGGTNQIDKIIDLTWAVDVNPISWPNNKKFMYTRQVEKQNEDGSWYATNEYCSGEHGGTHLDAPYHFYQQGWKVDDIPIERFFVQGVLVDISQEVNDTGRSTQLTIDHLDKWIKEHGSLPNNTVMLIRYGWSQYYSDYDAYMGEGATPNFPGMTPEAARWLVDSKRIIGVGVDTASLDQGNSTTFDVHKILCSHQIYGLENLNIPEDLPAKGFSLVILPMKLKHGTGAAARVIAVPKSMANW
nr:uncharacterized protein LOC111416294 [Onthophagus taurus]